MQSKIDKITPLATEIGTSPEVTITGSNFTDGGDPKLYIDNLQIKIKTFTYDTITFDLPKSLPKGKYTIIVLNGEEQAE